MMIATYYPAFRKQAWQELALAGAANIQEMTRGAALADAPPFDDFAGLLACLPPIFTRHIMPVDATLPLTGERDTDLPRMLEAAAGVAALAPGEAFAVQCRVVGGAGDYNAKDVEVFVGRHFDALGAIPTFSDYNVSGAAATVISVYIHYDTCRLGVCSNLQTLNAHADEYRALSRSPRAVSRAENKLREAIAKYKLLLLGGHALDMGAAPGGWTNALAQLGYRVTAVDPGALHPSLADNPNITHLRKKIQDCVFDEPFDLIVNDMNISPDQTARITCGLAPLLRDGGCAVVTLKLPGADTARAIAAAAEILNERYDVGAIHNLTHNRTEVTALLYKL